MSFALEIIIAIYLLVVMHRLGRVASAIEGIEDELIRRRRP